MEKVARKKIGVLTSSKTAGNTPKIIYPADREKLKHYSRIATDYSILDNLGTIL